MEHQAINQKCEAIADMPGKADTVSRPGRWRWQRHPGGTFRQYRRAAGALRAACGTPQPAQAPPKLHSNALALALLPFCCCLELRQHVGVDLLLQLVGPLVKLPHKPKLPLQLKRHIGDTCGQHRQPSGCSTSPQRLRDACKAATMTPR